MQLSVGAVTKGIEITFEFAVGTVGTQDFEPLQHQPIHRISKVFGGYVGAQDLEPQHILYLTEFSLYLEIEIIYLYLVVSIPPDRPGPFLSRLQSHAHPGRQRDHNPYSLTP